jgi:hypothetical protein
MHDGRRAWSLVTRCRPYAGRAWCGTAVMMRPAGLCVMDVLCCAVLIQSLVRMICSHVTASLQGIVNQDTKE